MGAPSNPAPGRRQVLQVLAGSVGAGLAAPSLAKADASHAAHAHPAPTLPVQAEATSAAPGLLDANQLETLASLAEAVIPGSTDAGVAPFVDRLLAADTPERQRDLIAALGALQAESLTRFGRPWLSLDAAQRTVLLTTLSTGPSARATRYWTQGEPVITPPGPPRPPTLRDRFEVVKERIATAYWTSENGMKELGWTGEMIHPEFPTCSHTDHGSD
jgi:Gluconate 2-dehydrogenase subunit 3